MWPSKASFGELKSQVEKLVEKLHALEVQQAGRDSGSGRDIVHLREEVARLAALIDKIPALDAEIHRMDIRLQAVEKIVTSLFASVKEIKEYIVQPEGAKGEDFNKAPAPFTDEGARAQDKALDELNKEEGEGWAKIE